MGEAVADGSSGHSQGEYEREQAVSAAVGMVVASARLGVVTLCASVAHIIRDKMRLEQQVTELEKKLEALENSCVNRVSGVTCHSTINGESLPESPSSLRCGSAPPSFLIIPPRKLSGNDNQIVQEVCQNCESGGSQFYSDACWQRQAAGNHDSSPNNAQSKRSEIPGGFVRGQTHASTRSLNLCRVPSASRFMRRKYSTISLRRIHRASLGSKGSSSGTLSQSSSSSESQEWAEDSSRRGSSGSRTCVVTVAEVYTPPSPPPLPTTESAAIKLLAKKLASMMQEEDWENEPSLGSHAHLDPPPGSPAHLDPPPGCPAHLDPPPGCPAHLDPLPAPQPSTHAQEDLYAPHPLAGCECVVCTRLSSDPAAPMYSLTTSKGSLLPRGSTVLVRGDMVGTVTYFGHRRHPLLPSRGVRYHSPAALSGTAQMPPTAPCNGGVVLLDETGSGGDVSSSSPLGVTVALWSPDQGEMFVPLRDVICQLDEEADTESRESTHSPTLVDCYDGCHAHFVPGVVDCEDRCRRVEFQEPDPIREEPQNILDRVRGSEDKVRGSEEIIPCDDIPVSNPSAVIRLGQTSDYDDGSTEDNNYKTNKADCYDGVPTHFIPGVVDYEDRSRRVEFQEPDPISTNPHPADLLVSSGDREEPQNILNKMRGSEDKVRGFEDRVGSSEDKMRGSEGRVRGFEDRVRGSEDIKPCDDNPVSNPSAVIRLGRTSDCDNGSTEDNYKSSEDNYSVLEGSVCKLSSSYVRPLFNSENELLRSKNLEPDHFSVNMHPYESRTEQRRLDDAEPEVSLYDTSDSAISLTFTRRPHSCEEICCVETSTSQPTSLTETDVESLHFGDTWDSGCYTRRDRRGSLSSEQLSDMECEGARLMSPWVQSLNEAFDSVWDKHPRTQDLCGPYSSITRPITDYPYRNSIPTTVFPYKSFRPATDNPYSSTTRPAADSGASIIDLGLKDYPSLHQAPNDRNTLSPLYITNCIMDESEV